VLHDSSAYKNDVKVAWIDWDRTTWAGVLASCDAFAKPNYMKVLGNRPLVFSYGCGTDDIGPWRVAGLRRACREKGYANPYVVIMHYSKEAADTCATTEGYDAVSSYAQPAPSQNQPYSEYADKIVSDWTDYSHYHPPNSNSTTDKKVVPWVSAGWDPRPRVLGLDFGSIVYTYPYGGMYGSQPAYVQRPQPWQISSEVFSAFHFNRNWPNIAEANTAIVYAWNEFTEGGWLCPTTFGGAIDTSRVDKLHLLTQNYLENVAQGGTSGASSSWPGYPATNAFDGNQSVWQCNTATNCALWVFFAGGTKLVNKIAISEAYRRVTGFTVYYRSGTNWLPLTSGTNIGDQKYLTTSTVNTNGIMLYMQSTHSPIIRELQAFGIP
jgi:hypothetical protein